MLNRSISSLIMTVLLLMIFSNFPILSDGETSDLNSYSTSNDIKFVYPKDWDILNQNNGTIRLSAPRSSEANVTILASNYDFEENENNLESYVKETFPDQKAKCLTINEYPVCKLDEIKDNLRKTQYVVIKDDRVYSFISTISKGLFYDYSTITFPIFQSFLDNLKRQNPSQNVGIDIDNLYDIEVNPNNNKIYVSKTSENIISVVDGNSDIITKNISLTGIPKAMVLSPLHNLLYALVQNNSNYSLTIIDSLSDMIIANGEIGSIDSEGSIIFDVSANGTAYITARNLDFTYVIDVCSQQDVEECRNSLLSPNEDVFNISNMSIGKDSRDLFTSKYANDGKIYLLKNEFGSGSSELDIFENENTTNKTFDTFAKDLTINPLNEKIYILNSENIQILDNGLTYDVLNEIELPENTNFNQILYNPATNAFYLTDRSSNKVFVIDEQGGKNYTSFAVGKNYLGADLGAGQTRFLKKMDINPNTNTIYIADNEAEKLFVVNASTHIPTATIRFSTLPQSSGNIYCDKNLISNTYVKFPSNKTINCIPQPREGYRFVSWKGDIATDLGSLNQTRSANNLFDLLFGSDAKNSMNFPAHRFGNLTATFERTPTIYELSSQTLTQLSLLVLAPLVGYFIPRIATWINLLRHRKHFNKYLNKIVNTYNHSESAGTIKINEFNSLKTEILESYSKDQLSESYYKVLIEKIEEYIKSLAPYTFSIE